MAEGTPLSRRDFMKLASAAGVGTVFFGAASCSSAPENPPVDPKRGRPDIHLSPQQKQEQQVQQLVSDTQQELEKNPWQIKNQAEAVQKTRKVWGELLTTLGYTETITEKETIYRNAQGKEVARMFLESPKPDRRPADTDYRFTICFPPQMAADLKTDQFMNLLWQQGLFYTRDRYRAYNDIPAWESGATYYYLCPKITNTELAIVQAPSPVLENHCIVEQGTYAVIPKVDVAKIKSLITWGAGPCEAILMYDPKTKGAALGHYQNEGGQMNMIDDMITDLVAQGAQETDLQFSTEPDMPAMVKSLMFRRQFKNKQLDYTLPTGFRFDIATQQLDMVSEFPYMYFVDASLNTLLDDIGYHFVDDGRISIMSTHGISYTRGH